MWYLSSCRYIQVLELNSIIFYLANQDSAVQIIPVPVDEKEREEGN